MLGCDGPSTLEPTIFKTEAEEKLHKRIEDLKTAAKTETAASHYFYCESWDSLSKLVKETDDERSAARKPAAGLLQQARALVRQHESKVSAASMHPS